MSTVWAGSKLSFEERCQILARIVALIYNWWSLFTRLAIPNRHTEATTSRPLLLHGIGRQTTHRRVSSTLRHPA